MTTMNSLFSMATMGIESYCCSHCFHLILCNYSILWMNEWRSSETICFIEMAENGNFVYKSSPKHYYYLIGIIWFRNLISFALIFSIWFSKKIISAVTVRILSNYKQFTSNFWLYVCYWVEIDCIQIFPLPICSLTSLACDWLRE